MLGFAACLDLGVPCTCLVVYFLSYYMDLCHSCTHMTLHFRSTWCAFVVDRERAYSAAVSTIVRGPRSVWLPSSLTIFLWWRGVSVGAGRRWFACCMGCVCASCVFFFLVCCLGVGFVGVCILRGRPHSGGGAVLVLCLVWCLLCNLFSFRVLASAVLFSAASPSLYPVLGRPSHSVTSAHVPRAWVQHGRTPPPSLGRAPTPTPTLPSRPHAFGLLFPLFCCGSDLGARGRSPLVGPPLSARPH